MGKSLTSMLSAAVVFLAAFSSSTSYQLQSYGINGAASNSAASATYQLEGVGGQIQSVSTSSTNYAGLSGSIQAQQANVPPAPTLSNGGGTFYNKLGLIIANGGNPTDATFAVAVSSDNFVTTYYVQADGSLNTTPLFQTYVGWGSGSGTTITGLSVSTTYKAKVEAMTGKFTTSAFGPTASATTASPSISFSVSPNSQTLPNLLSGTVENGATITASFATNATFGGTVYVSDTNAGLKSASHSKTIASATGNISSASDGYGLHGSGVTQTSGGPLSLVSPYNGATNVVGALVTTPQAVFTTTAPIVGGSGTAILQAKASATDSAANDYTDTLSFIAAASF